MLLDRQEDCFKDSKNLCDACLCYFSLNKCILANRCKNAKYENRDAADYDTDGDLASDFHDPLINQSSGQKRLNAPEYRNNDSEDLGKLTTEERSTEMRSTDLSKDLYTEVRIEEQEEHFYEVIEKKHSVIKQIKQFETDDNKPGVEDRNPELITEESRGQELKEDQSSLDQSDLKEGDEIETTMKDRISVIQKIDPPDRTKHI